MNHTEASQPMQPTGFDNGVDRYCSRRGLLRGTLGSALGMAAFEGAGLTSAAPIAANKKLLLLFLSGGASQLETFDPKPDSKYGGPFRSIATSLPGIRVGELLPHTAKAMHRLAVIRSVNTGETSHFRGHYLLQSGRKVPGYPVLGSAVGRMLEKPDDLLPKYVTIRRQNAQAYTDVGDAGFLGPQYEGVMIIDGKPPANLARHDAIDTATAATRDKIRSRTDARFLKGRAPRAIRSYADSFRKADALMRERQIFDLDRESAADRERYGDHHFGRNCLLARRLLEAGVDCVKVTHHDWDAHFENFHWQRQRCLEFDRTFVTLLDDFEDRGLLDETLIVIMGEMGRTPRINYYAGRDHWGDAWSMAFAGCGIKPGVVLGKTNDLGTEVVDGQVDASDLFHTVLQAMQLDSSASWSVGGRENPVVDP
ncbi:MAG: DUF1501 domain-containing protein, partial [Planctomycetota bacterium]|nr:DUF1501 domain-containing protein [Planctomycetota bacterium]